MRFEDGVAQPVASSRWSLLLPLFAILVIAGIGFLLRAPGAGEFEGTGLLWFRLDHDPSQVAGGAWARDFWLALSWIGDSGPRITIASLIVLCLLALGRWQNALFIALVLGSGVMMSQLMKQLIDRPRPAVVPPLDQVGSASFPSGHALNSTLFYLLLALVLAGWLRSPAARAALFLSAVSMAAATGVSRLALGVHYPSDVLAGGLIAIAWLWFCWGLSARVWPQLTRFRSAGA